MLKKYCPSFGFSSSHVRMWELDILQRRLSVEELMLSNCGAGEDSWESLGQQGDQINQSDSKENQPWILIGRTDAEAQAQSLILWPLDVNSQLIGKDPDAGKDWRHKEKRATEDEVAGWHHWFNGHQLGRTLLNREGQGGRACWSPWDSKESDTT